MYSLAGCLLPHPEPVPHERPGTMPKAQLDAIGPDVRRLVVEAAYHADETWCTETDLHNVIRTLLLTRSRTAPGGPGSPEAAAALGRLDAALARLPFPRLSVSRLERLTELARLLLLGATESARQRQADLAMIDDLHSAFGYFAADFVDEAAHPDLAACLHSGRQLFPETPPRPHDAAYSAAADADKDDDPNAVWLDADVRKVFELALREALGSGRSHVISWDMLIAVVHHAGSHFASDLADSGFDIDTLRRYRQAALSRSTDKPAP